MRKLYIYLSVFYISLGILSCERPEPLTKYSEIVIEALPDEKAMPDNDPHAFMNANPDMRQLAENNPQIQQMLANSTAETLLKWKTPVGWIEEPGAGMRKATFRSSDPDEKDLEVSIVSLSGDAGGFEANVVRWLRQINVSAPSADEMRRFVQSQERLTTEGGLEILLVDLTYFQKTAADDAPSTIGAILQNSDQAIFIKMTGSKKILMENLGKFKQLCQSLAL